MLHNAYSGRSVVIVSCGPSLNTIDPERLRSVLGGLPVIAVKQAIDQVRENCDFHCWNPYNVSRFDVPATDTIRCLVTGPGWAPPQWNKSDIIFPQTNSGGDLACSLAMSRDFDAHLLTNGPLRPFGPGIMFELVFYLAVHLGVSEILTLGWDIASPSGHNSHFYDSAIDAAFFERDRVSDDSPWRSIRDSAPEFVRRAASTAKTRRAHARGEIYNRTRPLIGETELVSSATESVVNWLQGHGVRLSARTDSQFVARFVDTMTSEAFLDRLADIARDQT